MSTTERTVVLVRVQDRYPNGGNHFDVNRYFQCHGFVYVDRKEFTPTPEQLKKHFGERNCNRQLEKLIESLAGQSFMLFVYEGKGAVNRALRASGQKPNREPRAVLPLNKLYGDNLVWASKTHSQAQRQIKLWFPGLVEPAPQP